MKFENTKRDVRGWTQEEKKAWINKKLSEGYVCYSSDFYEEKLLESKIFYYTYDDGCIRYGSDQYTFILNHFPIVNDKPDLNQEKSWHNLNGLPISNCIIENKDNIMSRISSVECIDFAEHFNFNLGTVIKYIWLASSKGDSLKDLEEAKWYLEREIEKVKK